MHAGPDNSVQQLCAWVRGGLWFFCLAFTVCTPSNLHAENAPHTVTLDHQPGNVVNNSESLFERCKRLCNENKDDLKSSTDNELGWFVIKESEMLVCIFDHSARIIETCRYRNGIKADRMVIDRTAVLIDMKTQKKKRKEIFRGLEPEQCSPTIMVVPGREKYMVSKPSVGKPVDSLQILALVKKNWMP